MKFLKVFVVILACAGFLFAQVEGSKAEEKAETKAQEKTEQKAGAMSIHGTVVSVDVINNSLIVKTKKGEDTLGLESGAKIMMGKKDIALGDLKVGTHVMINWKMMEGKKMAIKIVEKAIAMAKKETIKKLSQN